MSQLISGRRRIILVAVVALAVVILVAVVIWRVNGAEDTDPASAAASSPTSPGATASPSATEESKATRNEKKDGSVLKQSTSGTPTCEDATTQFNREGVEKGSLLPDCGGTPPVTRQQQKVSGLGLACGGSYPVILFKTTTSGAKTSICGKTTSGETFRLVSRPTGGETVDIAGSYDPQRDAFVASKGGTRYLVEAYSGDLVVVENGRSTKQESSDYISLDNEPDGE